MTEHLKTVFSGEKFEKSKQVNHETHQITEAIIRFFLEETKLSEEDLFGKLRKQRITNYRHTLAYILVVYVAIPKIWVGKILNRNHASIINSINVTEDVLYFDNDYKVPIKTILDKTKDFINKYKNKEIKMYNHNLNQLSKLVHEGAVSKGFYSGEAGEMNNLVPVGLMNITTEATEALEAHKKGFWVEHFRKEKYNKLIDQSDIAGANEYFAEEIDHTVDVEIADIMIRCLDFCGTHGIDIDFCIEAKMRKNKKRPALHGNKY